MGPHMEAELGGPAGTEANSEGPSVSSLGTPTPRTKMTATGLPCLKDKPQKRMTSPWEAEDPG